MFEPPKTGMPFWEKVLIAIGATLAGGGLIYMIVQIAKRLNQ